MTWLTFELILKNISREMALCKFGHFSLVSGISQIVFELEPHNLIIRLVVMRRQLKGSIASGHE